MDGAIAPVPDPSPPKKPKKKRSVKKRVALWTLVLPWIVLALLIALIFALPIIVSPERLRDEVVSALTDTLGVPVRIGRLTYHPATGFEVFDVVVGPPPGFERDVFRAKRIAARYDLKGLASKHIVVDELAVDDPHVVLETKDGVRNVDAILAHLAEGAAPPAEEAPGEDEPAARTGRLSPIDVDVEKLNVGPLVVEVVGEGPNVRAHGIALTGRASIADELFLDVALTTDSEGAPNVVAKVPGPPSVDASTQLDAKIGLEVRAGATDGLELRVVKLAGKLDTHNDVALGDVGRLEPARVRGAILVDLDAAKDEVKVSSSLGYETHSLLDANARVEGLTQTLVQLLGAVPGRALAGGTLGLPAGGEAKMAVTVERVHLPLTALAPYVAVFAPDVTAKGAVNLGVLASGTPAAFVAGAPETLNVTMHFDDVSGSHTPSAAAAAGMNGSVELVREADGYRAGGEIEIAKVRQAANRIGATTVRLAARMDRLAYPDLGAMTATVSLAANDVDASGTFIDLAEASAAIAGDDVFLATRPVEPAVDVRLTANTRNVRVPGAGGAMRVSGTALELVAELDRVLEPAREPIRYDATTTVRRVALPDGTEVDRTRLRLTGTTEDPRHGRPFDVTTRANLAVAAARTAAQEVEGLDAKLSLTARRIGSYRPKKFPGPPPAMLPASVAYTFDADIARVAGTDPSVGAFEAAAELHTKMAVDVLRGDVKIERLVVGWPGVLAMSGSGTAKDVYDPRPTVDVALEIPPVDLAKAIGRLPPKVLESTPPPAARGTVAMNVAVAGRVPTAVEKLDLTRPPMNVTASFDLGQVAVKSPSHGLDLEGLDGHFGAVLGRGRATTEMDVSLARVESGVAGAKDVVERLVLKGAAGLIDGVWAAKANGAAASVSLGRSQTGDLGGAKFELNARHPLNGGVELEALSFALEKSNLGFSATGRLTKETYGVLEPRLNVVADVDLATARLFSPSLDGTDGRVKARFSVSPGESGVIDLDGALELEDVDYATPTLAIVGASGRVPFHQRIVLPPPKLNEQYVQARGILGDDAEVRLQELQGRFERARMTLDAEDILVSPPRTADHQALRPYRTERGPSVGIESIQTGNTKLQDVLVEASYGEGLFRLDRLEARLWEGDVSTDLALQLTPDLDILMRLRGTVTNLNLDQPYAMAKGIDPVRDPDEKDRYRASATFDLEFGVRDRVVNGNMDVFKISRPLVERLFGALDPSGTSSAVFAISVSESVGLRPVGAKVWIAHNLLNAQFEFKRLWIHASYESASPGDLFLGTMLIFLRPALIPTLGGLWVVPTINGVIRRISLSNVIDPYLEQMAIDRKLAVIRPYVASTPGASAQAAAE